MMAEPTMRPDSVIEQRHGWWFVCVNARQLPDPITLRASKTSESGAEVVENGVYGPFGSEHEAMGWLQTYDPLNPF